MATAPYQPYVISGYVYDTDGSTKVTSGVVYVDNYTKGTTTSSQISSDGDFELSLANLRTGWDTGDVVYVTAEYKGLKFSSVRLVVLTGDDGVYDVDLYLREGKPCRNSCRLMSAAISCGATAKGYSFIERGTESVRLQLNGVANTTVSPPLGKDGIYFNEGYYIIEGTSGVTTHNQSSGKGNARGTTTSQVDCVLTLDNKIVSS